MQLTQTVQVRQVNHIGKVGQKWKKQTLKNLDTKLTADRNQQVTGVWQKSGSVLL